MGEHAHLLTKQITLDTHVEDVVSYIQLWELSNVVLVGHSYGGRITTRAADRLEGPGAIGRTVYLDAAVPEDGDRWYSFNRTEDVTARGQSAASHPRTCIDCVDPFYSDFNELKPRLKSDPAWRYVEIETGHDTMVAAPEEVTRILTAE